MLGQREISFASVPAGANPGVQWAVQGQDTDPAAVAEIRDAVRNGSEASVRLLNYKKNGQPFWNMFTLAPMADVDGNLRFIIGVQVRRCDTVRCEGRRVKGRSEG